MDNNELIKRHQELLHENQSLKQENSRLKEELRIYQTKFSRRLNNFPLDTNNENNVIYDKNIISSTEKINKSSEIQRRIEIFMKLFRGRDDVYAKRWENRKKGTSGYSPVCSNEWVPGVCQKPKAKCRQCNNKAYIPLDEKIIENHLRGNIVVGIYPMLSDETCYFLAIDFDGKNWQKDATAIRDVCTEFNIPQAFERSRSGNGTHAWFFFNNPIPAITARKFGSALLTYAMSKRYEIAFDSYDRLFPNQDTMPKGGFGNLIALPLQKAARSKNNSVFIDADFKPYEDQWNFLSGIQVINTEKVDEFITELCPGNELGTLKREENDIQKPWRKEKTILTRIDLPKKICMIKAGMIYIPKKDFSPKALNSLKRMAAFKNPEYYKAQAMRMPTFKKPRIISCSEDFENYLSLPRGCESDIYDLLKANKTKINWQDERFVGKKITVEFNGILRNEQQNAVNELLKYENGVLSATTAFGKTVIAAYCISKQKVNTLILVHRQQLLSQWLERLSEFLRIDEVLPELEKKRGRKRKQNIIGHMAAGNNKLNGIIDVAIMQSLYSDGEVKECVKQYGMIIVDECHHIPAFSFEQIVKRSTAKFIYGLTATPARKDGQHPIIFMHCGSIRYTVDAKKQADKRPFDHFVIPRFTGFRVTTDKDQDKPTIQEIYASLIQDEMRNQHIVDDVIKKFTEGKNCILLTERTAHVEILTKKLSEKIPDVISLTGGMGIKKTREILNKITTLSYDKQLTIVATGKFVGEGFDEPRLDTLFLAMPISWKGTLNQYAGRLHRLYETKKEVQIFDYVDIHVKMLENMYNKRLRGYALIGYKAKADSITDEPTDIIFDKQNFFPVYTNDIQHAQKEIVIVSPFATIKRVNQIMHYLNEGISKQVSITILTRPLEFYSEKRRLGLDQIFTILRNIGIIIQYKSNIHQKFAIIDQRIVWYGSINLLSFGYSEESIMRLYSSSIAIELLNSIDS
jgi:superfamily II DNA or RNA helicase